MEATRLRRAQARVPQTVCLSLHQLSAVPPYVWWEHQKCWVVLTAEERDLNMMDGSQTGHLTLSEWAVHTNNG